mgnify:CR=1 FL=1
MNDPNIYLARHCRTDWNMQGRLQGKTDRGLSKDGIRQSEENIRFLSGIGFDVIFSSPAKRAFQTARIYAESLDIPVKIKPGFSELDHGDWEGKSISDLMNPANSRYSEWLKNPADVKIPGGSETVFQAAERFIRDVRIIVSSYPGETVLIVSHKHIMALFECAMDGYEFSRFREKIFETVTPRRISEEVIKKIPGSV